MIPGQQLYDCPRINKYYVNVNTKAHAYSMSQKLRGKSRTLLLHDTYIKYKLEITALLCQPPILITIKLSNPLSRVTSPSALRISLILMVTDWNLMFTLGQSSRTWRSLREII